MRIKKEDVKKIKSDEISELVDGDGTPIEGGDVDNYTCPNDIINLLQSNIRQYRGSEDVSGFKKVKRIIDSGKLSYDQMKQMKSFFDNSKDKNDEYNLLGGKKMKQWVDKELGKSRDAIHQVKKTRMDAGEENQFKKKHEKDKDNANPTKVRIPNISKSSSGRNIMTNKVVYESLNDEIKEINYLMEYMNNNK